MNLCLLTGIFSFDSIFLNYTPLQDRMRMILLRIKMMILRSPYLYLRDPYGARELIAKVEGSKLRLLHRTTVEGGYSFIDDEYLPTWLPFLPETHYRIMGKNEATLLLFERGIHVG